VAVVYLLRGAPFISSAQMSVYAGASMRLVLVVIILLVTDKITTPDPVRWQRPLVIILAAAVVIEGAYVLITRYGAQATASLTAAEVADPATIGTLLYTKFSLPFEVTSIILLVAAIGAVVLARPKLKEGGNQ